MEKPVDSNNFHVAIDLSNAAGFDNYGYYDSTKNISNIPIHGAMGSDNFDDIRKRSTGKTAQFLNSSNFGWLLDVNDAEDEQKPLLEELDIDLTDIYYKIRCVLLPFAYFRLKLNIIRESPDFWGPLIVVLIYSLVSLYGQISVLSWILTIWIIGSFCIFFLAKVLGANVGYTQVLGIVGYCLLPLTLTGAMMPLFSRFPRVKIILGCFGILWSVYSAGSLLCVDELQEKRNLVLYPVFLLYIYFFSLYSGV